ncbi:PsiF family protein [Aquabacterium sp. A7-Y]|uniref:PsiF family protein n=1 Tax=Aquabacterium sp. A7-Y TaxID=1349605 RepID=UPI00223DB066|nr:PsiF family protein [Aquabacterium sp. A7-Y]MCW7539950.1 PsiF family protein [Aquabacterium sp. A7-Y]
MSYPRWLVALLLAVAGPAALGQTAAPDAAASAPTAQQNKMAECNQAAADRKGDERKAFMKDCLTNKQKAQQNKMKSCNADAKDLKGAERKAFMSECLKKKA